MTSARLNLLLLVLALSVALVAITANAGFDFFKKKDKDQASSGATTTTTTPAPQSPQSPQSPGPTAAGERGQTRPSLTQTMSSVNSFGSRAAKRRLDLDQVRAAYAEQNRLATAAGANQEPESARKYPARVQGRGRHAATGKEAGLMNGGGGGRDYDEQLDVDDDDEIEDRDGYYAALEAYRNGGKEGPANLEDAENQMLSRFKNQKVRDALAVKFVSTRRNKDNSNNNNNNNDRKAIGGGGGGGDAANKLSINVKVNNRAAMREEARQKKKEGVANYWGKKLNKAVRMGKKGLKAGATAISELPKYVEAATDSINAFLQLDGKGKLLALIDSVNSDINFVRKQFSQFSLDWSPAMEQALNYLGDTGLDKIKWNDKDELDMRKDALHSIVFGYEFMRLMIAWRENLLMAHEAYKLWLESMKSDYETKRFDITEDVVMQLNTIQNYLLLISWDNMAEQSKQNRANLDWLMEVEDDRPKNYESDYFRNIIVFQELYLPAIEEIEEEQEQVSQSISASGVVVDNLEQVDEFFERFRKSVESGENDTVDCKVPHELTDFLDKLKPQVEQSPLVYVKGLPAPAPDTKEQAD